MKSLLTKLVLLIVCFSFSTAFAGEPQKTKKSYQNIESNLLRGLESNNEGLKASCAYFLGEIKSSKAVIPLMHLLHSGTTEELRIMAALSLYKISSEKGIFAVERSAIFDDSDRVKRMCKNFYTQYLMDQSAEVEVEGIEVAEIKSINGYTLADFNK